MVYEFDRTKYERLRDMQAARRAKYLDLVRGGMNFTQAAHAVGVSKRTGKVWRNGRTRSTGRNGRPLSDRYRGGMDKPKRIDAGHLCMDERIAIADMRRAATSPKSAACTGRTAPGRGPPTAPDAPSHARSCPAHDCGTRPRPDSTSTGAPNRPAAGSDAATRIMEA